VSKTESGGAKVNANINGNQVILQGTAVMMPLTQSQRLAENAIG